MTNTIPTPLTQTFGTERRWVNWKLEPNAKGEMTKVPYNPRGYKAGSTKPDSWSSLDETARAQGFSGVGIVFTPERTLLGVDLDHVLDEQGHVDDTASMQFIAAAKSYAEVSPSGDGLHVFLTLTEGLELDANSHKPNPKIKYEAYTEGRYFTVTGKGYDDWGAKPVRTVTPDEAKALLSLLGYPWTKTQTKTIAAAPRRVETTATESDDVSLIERIRHSKQGPKFDALFLHGDLSLNNNDASSADLSLCQILAFWTRRDAARIDRLFRQSALMRDKWDTRHHGDGRTYGQGTIDRALENQSEELTEKKVHKNFDPGPMDELGEVDSFVDEVFQKREDDDTFYLKANLTDAGNAECLAFKCKEVLRYDHTSKRWRLWDGQRWGFDSKRKSEQFAVRVARERRMAFNLDKNEEGWKFALRSENLRNVRNMLESAMSLEDFATDISQYDQNRMLACAGEHTLDLTDGSARENRREDYITLRLGANYDPDATCPRWIRFINELFPSKPEMVAYVQRAFGYCLTGDTREQMFFMCHGGGRNGKSTFLEVLRNLAGEYAGSTGFETFDADTGEARGDLAKLRACRVVTVIESDEDRHLAEARVKSITGGDEIVARELYAMPFSYKPQFKLWLAMNHLPIIRGSDEGIWRRVHLLPFTQNFEGREDKDLGRKLYAELSGILNWALAGLCQWHEQGLNPPDEVKNATLRYRADSDLMGQWIEASCILGPGKEMTSGVAYQNYRQWAEGAGLKPMSQNAWGRRLSDRGITNRKSSGKVFYLGIGLTET